AVVGDPDRSILVGDRLVGLGSQVDDPEPRVAEHTASPRALERQVAAGVGPTVLDSVERALDPARPIVYGAGRRHADQTAHRYRSPLGARSRINVSTCSRNAAYENGPRARSRPASPRRAASASSFTNRTTASATATGSRPSTTRPLTPSRTTSSTPPPPPATTGKP